MPEDQEQDIKRFVTFTGELAAAIDKQATEERRSFRNMVEKLASEALEARESKRSEAVA